MKTNLSIASGLFLAAFATTVSIPAQAKTMKECAAQWQEMKANSQTNGMKYRDFSKQCMSEGAPAAETPPPAPPPPIELTFFGYSARSSGLRRAFLLKGDDVFIAAEGDVVDHRYKVTKIEKMSVQVEHIPYAHTQSQIGRAHV